MTEHSNKDSKITMDRELIPCQSEIIIIIGGVEYNLVPKSNTYTSKDNLASGSNVAGVKDWEIVALIGDEHKNIVVGRFDLVDIPSGYSIDAVRRLSSGEVFSIGDEDQWGEIASFHLNKESECGMFVGHNDGNYKSLNQLKKVTKPEALFVTEDGKEITKDNWHDDIWLIQNGKFNVYEKVGVGAMINGWFNQPADDKKTERWKTLYKTFSTELSAHQYVSENKPSFSIKDFKDILIRYDYELDMMEEVFTDLKYLGNLNDKNG